MDENRSYLETTIFIREGFTKTAMSEKVSEKVSQKDSQKSEKREAFFYDLLDNKILIENSDMSELEKTRLARLLAYVEQLNGHKRITSARAAKILDIQQKTAARLLAKAEKNDILESEGKTKNKSYKIKNVS